MRRIVLVIFAAVMFAGCGEGTKQQPYLMGQNPNGPYAAQGKSEKIETAKIQAETQKQIALINKERDIEVQKLISQTDVTKADITKEVAIEEVAAKKAVAEQEHEFSTYLLFLLAGGVALLFFFLFYYTGKNRKERLKRHEEEMMYKLRLQEQEMKMKMAEKMLETISSGKLTPDQENRLINSLENTTTRLIDHNK